MSLELKNLKGTCDFMPQEQRVRNEIVGKLREVFECYGYQPLETPIICSYDILASKYAGGAEILKEVYKLKDQGQRDIGLRYDLTVPFARVVGMNPELRLPFKRYEIGKVFRDGPVKLGRVREFIQCDVDMVGVKSIMAEAELMIMAKEVFRMLGLDVYISYNNRKLLSGIIKASGIPEELEGSVILSVDKLEKIGEKGVTDELLEKGVRAESIKELVSILNMEGEEMVAYLKQSSPNELILEGLKELEELREYTGISGVADIMRFTPWLARGLEIYTGTVFEVFLSDGSITSSIAAGGRYGRIIGAFLNNGVEYPAVGMTFGLDVIYAALALKGINPQQPPVQVYIIPIGVRGEAVKLLCSLRKLQIATDIEMDSRRVKKSLEYASKQGIPYVIILGENEINSGKVKLRDMLNGIETEVEFDQIVSVLKERI